MTPQERDVISGIFERLKQAADQPRDPEAERFIAERLREQPYAPYAMAQAVYVQEQALLNLQAQVEALQAQLREAEERPAPQQQGGGFLSGIFGGGNAAPERPRTVPSTGMQRGAGSSGLWSNQSGGQTREGGPMQAAAAPGQAQGGPWGNQGAAAQPGRGGGFLGTALTTAAGVAGGMMLGSVLTNAFKGDGAGSAQAATPAAGSDAAAQPAADNTAYNDGSSEPATYQDASFDEGYDDGSADFGGDDWA